MAGTETQAKSQKEVKGITKIQLKKETFVVTLLVTILTTSILSGIVVSQGIGETVITAGSYIETADYTVYRSGSTYYAKARDGEITSHSVFNTLMNTLLSTSGISIHLASGTYIVENVIYLRSQCWIIGEGPNSTILLLDDNTNNDVLVLETGASRSSRGGVSNLQINGNKDTQSLGNGIVLNSTWKWTLENLFITQCKENGVFLSGQASPLDSLENIFRDVEVANCTKSGFKIGYTYDSVFINCYVEHCDENGFDVYSGSNSFYSCHAYHCVYGLNVATDVSECLFEDFWADTNHQHGILINGDHNRFKGCYSFNNGQDSANNYDGIIIDNGYQNIVEGCFAYDTQGSKTQRYGIKCDGNQSIIVNNYLTDNSWGGLNVGSPTVGNVFSNNYGALTEDFGYAQDKPNGAYITHDLGVTPTCVMLTSFNTTYAGIPYVIAWNIDNSNSTHFQIKATWTNGTDISDSEIDFSWIAKAERNN